MGHTKGEIMVIDNSGFVDGPFDTVLETRRCIKKNIKERFQYKGNCCIVKILGNYDNYCIGDTRYQTKQGLPLSELVSHKY
jgi:hypothetical protein